MGRFKSPTVRPGLGQPLGAAGIAQTCWCQPPPCTHPPISQVRVIKRTPAHTPHTHAHTQIGP